MNKKGDFDFEWLPGFREMMACQNEEQNTQQETDWGNENLQIEALLPPEQLQQEEQRYWKDYEYFIQMLPMVAREVWIVGDALLDQYEYKGSPIYSEYPDKVTILKIADISLMVSLSGIACKIFTSTGLSSTAEICLSLLFKNSLPL